MRFPTTIALPLPLAICEMGNTYANNGKEKSKVYCSTRAREREKQKQKNRKEDLWIDTYIALSSSIDLFYFVPLQPFQCISINYNIIKKYVRLQYLTQGWNTCNTFSGEKLFYTF